MNATAAAFRVWFTRPHFRQMWSALLSIFFAISGVSFSRNSSCLSDHQQCFSLTAGPSCGFQSPGGDQIFSNFRQELFLLKNKTSVALQWIPSHCGVGGNEEADRLSKMGSKLEQSAHPMSYNEAKTILRNNFRTEWRQRLDIGTKRTASTSWTEQHKSQSLG